MSSTSGQRKGLRPKPDSPSSLLMPNSSKSTRSSSSQFNTKIDPSVVRKPIEVSMTGMRQAAQVLANGNKEIRHYLFNEVNLIYECKVCFNMFRSLANLVAHKRSFCTKRLQDVKHIWRRDEFDLDEGHDDLDLEDVIVEPEAVETVLDEDNFDLTEYSESLETLKEAGFIEEVMNKPLFSDLNHEIKRKKKSIKVIVDRLKEKAICGQENRFYSDKEEAHFVRLQNIRATSKAVFQTYGQDLSEKTAGKSQFPLYHSIEISFYHRKVSFYHRKEILYHRKVPFYHRKVPFYHRKVPYHHRKVSFYIHSITSNYILSQKTFILPQIMVILSLGPYFY